jgi:hypothetical protein
VFLGSVVLIALIGDVRMLVRGGVSGVQRIARHLWRVCFALFIASASIVLARQRLFPVIMRTSSTLYLLSFLPLVLMIFWLFRVRGSRSAGRQLVRDTAFSAAACDRRRSSPGGWPIPPLFKECRGTGQKIGCAGRAGDDMCSLPE